MTSTVAPRRTRATVVTAPVYHVDFVLILSALLLSAFGMLMVYSATRNTIDGDPLYYVKRQGIALIVGFVAFALCALVDYRKLREYSALLYLGTVLLLVAVMSPLGSTAKGTQGWFALPGGFQLQPSEMAKVGLIIGLAGYLHSHRGDLDARRVAVTLFLAGIPMGLVLLQPDLGSALVLGAIALGMLAVAGVKTRHLAALVVLGLIGIVAIVQLGVLKGYQVDRLTSFVDQNKNAAATYNVSQSKAAIGNGGLTGMGFLKGTQTKLQFVPEQHTDFVFTVVGEEFGFLGGALMLGMFGLLVWRCWRGARLAGDFFGTLVCIGVLTMLAVQVFENVGMTMQIMPVTGIPLPLMSYGGSSIIATWACLGLVVNVSMRRFA